MAGWVAFGGTVKLLSSAVFLLQRSAAGCFATHIAKAARHLWLMAALTSKA
jgi:hypothetical protein